MRSLPISLTEQERNFGWLWWAFQLAFLPMLLNQGNRYLGSPLSQARLNFLFFCVNFAATTAVLGAFALRSCKQGLRQMFLTLRWAFFALVLYYLVKVVLSLATLQLFPDYANQNDGFIALMLQQEPVLISIGIVFLAPMVEELLYRGVIFGSLHQHSRLLAYSLSAVLFSLAHILGYLSDPVTFIISFVQYLPAGLCLAWAYERSGSILAPVLMHISINQLGVQLMR